MIGLLALANLLFSLGFAGFAQASEPSPWLDLHAHLFFYEGAGTRLLGDFSTPPHARDWKTRIGSKACAEMLPASGSGVIVVALYAHPLFPSAITGSLRDSIRLQLAALHRELERDPGLELARSPAELRSARARGHRAIILSLEGASGILETDADLAEFIDREGIRIVTPLHFSDDAIGGPALMGGISAALVSPLNWLDSMLHGHVTEEPGAGSPIPTNRLGLRPEGEALARKLLARHVWLDLAHAGDLSQEKLIPMIEAAGQPLLYTHTVLRRYYRSERGISARQLERVAATRGLVGLLPSEDMLRGTPELTAGDGGCGPGVAALRRQLDEAAAVVGADGVTLGSDINAPLTFLRPPCAAAGPEVDARGYWHYGQLGPLRRELRRLGTRADADPRATLARFLAAWERVTGSTGSRRARDP